MEEGKRTQFRVLMFDGRGSLQMQRAGRLIAVQPMPGVLQVGALLALSEHGAFFDSRAYGPGTLISVEGDAEAYTIEVFELEPTTVIE